MERSGSTSLLDGPSDAEEDAFLDEAGFADSDTADDPETATEEPEDDSDSDDPDTEEPDDEEPATDEDDEDDLDPRDLKRQLDTLAAERETERERVTAAVQHLQAEQQRAQTANLLVEMRARMTDDEWTAFTAQMTESFKDSRIAALQGQLTEIQQAKEDEAYEKAETGAFTAIMGHVDTELGGLSRVEKVALENCADAAQFKATLKEITEARAGMTEPARRALREKRRTAGADRGSVRGSGGATPAGKTYDNFNPEKFDDYLDDVGSPR